jgi:hypothetical protein
MAGEKASVSIVGCEVGEGALGVDELASVVVWSASGLRVGTTVGEVLVLVSWVSSWAGESGIRVFCSMAMWMGWLWATWRHVQSARAAWQRKQGGAGMCIVQC